LLSLYQQLPTPPLPTTITTTAIKDEKQLTEAETCHGKSLAAASTTTDINTSFSVAKGMDSFSNSLSGVVAQHMTLMKLMRVSESIIIGINLIILT
jgi:hypothetical protein